MRKGVLFLAVCWMATPLMGMNLLWLWDPCPYNWTGFYAGGFAGGAWGTRVRTEDRGVTPVGAFLEPFPFGYYLGGAAFGGATVGYNFQICTSVVGLENEVGYIHGSGRKFDPTPPLGFTILSSATLGNWYDALTLRLGYTFHGFLFYLKAGATFTQVSGRLTIETTRGVPVFNASKHHLSTSWAVGTGIEFAFWKRWSAKLEFLSLGSHKVLLSGPLISTTPNLADSWKHTIDQIYTAKFGINYRFNRGCFRWL